MSPGSRTEDDAARFAKRCPECGEPAATAPPRRAAHWLAATALTIAIGGIVLAWSVSHWGSAISTGIPVGQVVQGPYTLEEIRAIRDGERRGAGLFAAVIAPAAAWQWLPGDLRLWPEFADPALEATNVEWFRYGPVVRRPLRMSELAAMEDADDRDQRVAALILDALHEPATGISVQPPNGAALASASAQAPPKPRVIESPANEAVLKVTPDPVAMMSGRVDDWTFGGREILHMTNSFAASDPYYAEPLATSASTSPFSAAVLWPSLLLGSKDGSATRFWRVDIPAAAAALMLVLGIWPLIWLAVGGWRARRRRARFRAGQCTACGHALGPPPVAVRRTYGPDS